MAVDHPPGGFEAAVEALVERVVERKLAERDQAATYVSKEKLADLYGVKLRTIKTWRSKGLPGVPVGREIMFKVQACDRWIEQRG